ncbi:NHL repeat-containing protein [Paraliomyxa miuraensis]|uniref:hypothetical protein n=1 Tax=Paraliomyxa miuraensis TaxID=376150 RepID=UPI0022553B22|nr:hypothetical protein [Paraliomyxa miuraensis]MCX4246032.1 hypothetical protein [Paraliomyxa miuraensis]
MRNHLVAITASSFLSLSIACGDPTAPPAGTESDGESSGASTGTSPTITSVDETGMMTGSATSSTTGEPPGTTGDPPDTDGPGIKLDLGAVPDMPPPICGGAGNGDLSLSYIWIANSAQGTISKIDTTTMVEEGRYQARPAGGDPSRTSVNLAGDVAVANRNGGVTKFWANEEDCHDANGNGVINTSSGAGDVKSWGQEECMAWHTPLVCDSNRPVAWTRGEFDEGECAFVNMQLWTACDDQVLLLDGETGAIEETVPVPAGAGGWAFVYGGAADADGNFWGLDMGNNNLFRVDHQTLVTQSWPLPPLGGYGITVDSVGRPWVCGGGGVSRFDLVTATWNSTGGSGIGGCMSDGDQLIWHGNDFGLVMGFNIETLAVDEQIQLPEYVHGISVDFAGKVWGVSFAGSNAYRADPVTGIVNSYNNLIGAYTYSDMTGHALSTVGGGGMPPS